MGVKQRHHYWFVCIVGLLIVFIFADFYIGKQKQDRSVAASKEKERTKIEITFATGDVSWNRAIMNVADQFMSENPEILLLWMSFMN